MFQNTKARMSTSSDQGFTLIELLVVVIILGILSGIAVFSVGTFRQDAVDACTASNTRITTTATEAAAASGGDVGEYTATTGECTP
jgi:prepilin-type N-terminal cleavage/methylation domain-containing protein